MTKDQEKVFTRKSLRRLVARTKSKPNALPDLARIRSAGLLGNARDLETALSSYAF